MGSGGAAGATRDAADPRAVLGLGLSALVVVEPGFCDPNLVWPAGARGWTPVLVLEVAAGPLATRRGEAEGIVFMFLSSLWKPAP